LGKKLRKGNNKEGKKGKRGEMEEKIYFDVIYIPLKLLENM